MSNKCRVLEFIKPLNISNIKKLELTFEEDLDRYSRAYSLDDLENNEKSVLCELIDKGGFFRIRTIIPSVVSTDENTYIFRFDVYTLSKATSMKLFETDDYKWAYDARETKAFKNVKRRDAKIVLYRPDEEFVLAKDLMSYLVASILDKEIHN